MTNGTICACPAEHLDPQVDRVRPEPLGHRLEAPHSQVSDLGADSCRRLEDALDLALPPDDRCRHEFSEIGFRASWSRKHPRGLRQDALRVAAEDAVGLGRRDLEALVRRQLGELTEDVDPLAQPHSLLQPGKVAAELDPVESDLLLHPGDHCEELLRGKGMGPLQLEANHGGRDLCPDAV